MGEFCDLHNSMLLVRMLLLCSRSATLSHCPWPPFAQGVSLNSHTSLCVRWNTFVVCKSLTFDINRCEWETWKITEVGWDKRRWKVVGIELWMCWWSVQNTIYLFSLAQPSDIVLWDVTEVIPLHKTECQAINCDAHTLKFSVLNNIMWTFPAGGLLSGDCWNL